MPTQYLRRRQTRELRGADKNADHKSLVFKSSRRSTGVCSFKRALAVLQFGNDPHTDGLIQLLSACSCIKEQSNVESVVRGCMHLIVE